MKKIIKIVDLINFLELQKIDYEFLGEVLDSYYLASVFSPIDNGFYYIKGEQNAIITHNSLFLVNTKTVTRWDTVNTYLVVKLEAQGLYYKIMQWFFGSKSTGIVSNLSVIDPAATIGLNVQIDPFSVIGNVKIGDNVIIKSNSVINDGSIISDNVFIDSNSVIGAHGIAWAWDEEQENKLIQPQIGGVIIEESCILGANSIVVRGSINENTYIGKNCLIAPGCRLGHGTVIGEAVHLANSVVTGGNTSIGDYSFIGSMVVFRPKVRIHSHTTVGTGSVVIKDTSRQGLTLMGVPAIESETKVNPSGMPPPKKF